MKPHPRSVTYYDWEECCAWVSEKLGYDITDTLDRSGHFAKWVANHPADGEDSRYDFSRYYAAADGLALAPGRQDYRRFANPFIRQTIDQQGFFQLDCWVCEEPWQAEIGLAFLQEFGLDAWYWAKIND